MLYTQDSLAFSSTQSFVLEHQVFYIDIKGKHRIGVTMNVTPRLKQTKSPEKPKPLSPHLLAGLSEFSSQQLLGSLGKIGQVSLPEAITTCSDRNSHLELH